MVDIASIESNLGGGGYSFWCVFLSFFFFFRDHFTIVPSKRLGWVWILLLLDGDYDIGCCTRSVKHS